MSDTAVSQPVQNVEDEGLRKRNVGEKNEEKEVPQQRSKTDVIAGVLQFEKYADNPTVLKVVETLKQLEPVIAKIQELFYLALPYILLFIEKIKELWKVLEPYHPEEFAPALFGLFMTFFGGFYFTTFAAIEAYRVCGWETTVDCLYLIYEDIKKVRDAHEADDAIDEDGNGIPDVLEIDVKTLALRKTHLVLTTIDPMKVMDALTGISTGFLAVVATLRIQFAQTITMGVSIGQRLQLALEKYIQPVLLLLIPPEYARWIPVIIIYGSRSFGISIAWLVQRFISAFYSSFRGADLFASGCFKFLARNSWTVPFEPDSGIVSGFVLVFGTIGFLWQVLTGFSLPFPLNLLFFPVTLVEWFLTWMVAVQH